MKKFLLLILALFTMTASAFAADSEPRFDNMRTALIVSTTQRGVNTTPMSSSFPSSRPGIGGNTNFSSASTAKS